MWNVLNPLVSALADGRSVAVATVVAKTGSSPFPAGTSMIVDDDGHVWGDVSSGCVDAAAYDLALSVLESGEPVVRHFGGDQNPFDVALTCGGAVDIFVRRVAVGDRPLLTRLAAAMTGDHDAALATVVSGPAPTASLLLVTGDGVMGSLGSAELDRVVSQELRDRLGQDTAELLSTTQADVFVQSYSRRPRMLIFGGSAFAAAVATVGRFLGYRVTVCDGRPVFATEHRFPAADEIVSAWPHEFLATTVVDGRTVICVMTHDPKFETPLLEAALRSPAAYIGVLGSRQTQRRRIAALRAHGIADVELARLSAPIGLDVGAASPEETAISIGAEILTKLRGGTAQPLGDLAGPIHHDTEDARPL